MYIITDTIQVSQVIGIFSHSAVDIKRRYRRSENDGQGPVKAVKAVKAASTGKGGLIPHRASRPDLSSPNCVEIGGHDLIQTSILVLFRVFSTHEHPTSSPTLRGWSPQPTRPSPWAAFPGKQLASQAWCSPQCLSMSLQAWSFWIPSKVYKSSLMPAYKQLHPIL